MSVKTSYTYLKKKNKKILIFFCSQEAREGGIHSPNFRHLCYRNCQFCIVLHPSYFKHCLQYEMNCIFEVSVACHSQSRKHTTVRHVYCCSRCLFFEQRNPAPGTLYTVWWLDRAHSCIWQFLKAAQVLKNMFVRQPLLSLKYFFVWIFF